MGLYHCSLVLRIVPIKIPVLADLAVREPESFSALVEKARSALADAA